MNNPEQLLESGDAAPGPFKVVVLDIDGTIVGPDLTLSDRLRKSVKNAQSAGAAVLLATGRILGSALEFSRELETTGPLVCYQGAVTVDPKTGKEIRHARMDADLAGEALDMLVGESGQLSMLLDDDIYVQEESDWAVGYAHRMKQSLNIIDSLKKVSTGGPTLILSVDDPEPTGKRASRLAAHFGGRAQITHSLPHFCEVASPESGKLRALDQVLKGLDATPEQVVAFGDGVGDAEMLNWAGLGIAVGDAHPTAREAADIAIAGPEDDGVAQALELLIERNLLAG